MNRRIKPISFMAGVYLLGLILTGCGGGGGNQDPQTAPDVGLASLTLEGYDIEFDPLKTGPYSVDVAADVSEVQMTAVSSGENTVLRYTLESNLGSAGVGEPVDMESGSPATLKIGQGDNLVTVFVLDNEAKLAGQYYISIHRVSSSARLLPFSEFKDPINEQNITLTPAFDRDTFNYSADVGYTACSIEFRYYTNERNTTIQVNGESVPAARDVPFALDVGENLFSTVVTAEDGVTTQAYNFTITRAAGTEAQRQVNANLSSLTVSEGDMRFDCSTLSYALSVNRDTPSIDITATVAVDGATLTINDAAVVSGEPYNVALADGANKVEIEVTAADGKTTSTYVLNVQRLDRNVVDVDTVEELQAALLNAEPGDEIRVTAGRYEGVASVDTSGSDNAHFYSDRSGTVDDPIRLVAQSSTRPVLAGTGTSANAAFLLSGDYWQLVGLQFSSARNGLILSGASRNKINSVVVKQTGEQGIVIRNGSSDNIISNALIGETGVGIASDRTGLAEGIVVGSDDNEWASAPGGAGLYNEQDNNNVIRNSEFLSSIASEAIEINEGTLGTIVENNIFTSGSLTNAAGDSSLINVQGNDAVIRYNTFYYSDDENLAEVISVNDDSAAWNTETSWGENTRIYQNLFALEGQEIPLVRAEDVASVLVADNIRNDSVDPVYAGSGIDQNFSSPSFKIQPAADDSVCVDVEEIDDSLVMFLKACSSVQSQLWRLVMDQDKYVRIQNQQFSEIDVDGEMKDLYVTPSLAFSTYCPGKMTGIPALQLVQDLDGYLQRWGTVLTDEGMKFISKSDLGYALTAPEEFAVGDTITACGGSVTAEERQVFRLVEQQ